MSNETTWRTLEYYLNSGINIFPVHDKGDHIKKPAVVSWKKYQTELIAKPELFYLIEQLGTEAVAIVCGKISGNIEVIDVDVKNWYGIDAMLFQSIQTLYPDLWNKLRIHKTPSGGYHIIYRIINHEPGGNSKLTYKEGSKMAAIETRGEGGYIVAPPAIGYTVFLDNPIPKITWAERCSIFSICEGFSEVKKMAPNQSESRKTIDTFYDENPFQHFNGSQAGEDVLLQYGWVYLKSTNLFSYYERPGQTERGRVAASFNKQKRVFWIFTSSTALENDRGYNPSTIISVLQYNGDNKKTFQHLVNNGYGKIKAQVEKKLIKSAAINNTPLQANISQQAVTDYAILKSQLNDQHPFGIFWNTNEDGDVIIDREDLYIVAEGMGFKIDERGNVCKIENGIIYPKTDREFFDNIKAYIHEEDAIEYKKIANAYEPFIEKHGKFTIGRLQPIPTDQILSDNQNVSYKCFTNGVLQITSNSIELIPYESISQNIWKHKIQPRNYLMVQDGKYLEFLDLACGYNEYTQQIIGYLTHEYKDETTAFIIVLTEQCENPEDGGGSGKNVFCNLLRHATTLANKPGSQVKYDEKFLQSWNFERIFCLSDVPKNFEFMFLKDLASNDAIIKKLFKDEATVSVDNMPKFLIQTNYSYEVQDGGLRRRIIPIEFTDFFTRAGGIDVHFGCHFPRGWTDEDWGCYDTIIAKSIQKWLQCGLKLKRKCLTDGGWKKQFRQTWGNVISDMIEERWNVWVSTGEWSNEEWKRECENYFKENSIHINYQPSAKKMLKAIKIYAEKNEIVFDGNKQISSICKGKVFIMGNIPF